VTSRDGSSVTTGLERTGFVIGFAGRTSAVTAGRFFEAVEVDFLTSFRDDFLGTAFLLFELAFARGRAFACFFLADLGREAERFFLSFFLLAIRLQHRSEPASPVGSQETIRASRRAAFGANRFASITRVFLEVWSWKRIRLDCRRPLPQEEPRREMRITPIMSPDATRQNVPGSLTHGEFAKLSK
jgi:hypothetical protein